MASLSSARPQAAPAGRVGTARSLPDLLTLVLLLAVLAPVAVVFGQLPFWHRFEQPWPAFLAGALCCGLVALNRRPGWWLLVVIVLGLLATTVTMYRLMPGPGLDLRDQQFRERLQLWLVQARGGEQVYDDLAVVMWSTLAAWTAGMWSAWAALRAGWHWLVLASGGALLVSSIGYLPHWPAGGLALFVFFALLFLARLNHRQLVARASARGVPCQTGGRSAYAAYLAAVGAGALGLVAVGWMTPALRWHTPPLHRQTASSSSGGVQFYSAGGTRSVMHDFGPSLPFSGAVALGDAPVASVQADVSGYLFGVAYDHYDSGGWLTNAVDQPRTRASVPTASSPTDIERSRLDLRPSGEAAYQDSQPVDLTVQPRTATSVVLAAGPPLGLTASTAGAVSGRSTVVTRVTTRGLRGAPSNEVSELVTAEPIPAGDTYTSRGLVSNAAPGSLINDDGQLPDWVKSNYLQLPHTLPERVRVLAAQITRGAVSDYDRAARVQMFLRNLSYDQNIPAPPPNEDGVDYLLFVTGRGYCDYFASAMAVMLRSLGVPARVVAGYVMHEQGPDGRYIVRDKDAHAWTEVFFPGFGWQRFDATPGGAGQALVSDPITRSGNAQAAAAPPDARAASDPGAGSALSKPRLPARSTTWNAGGLALSRTALASAVIGLAALGAVALWLRSQRDRRKATFSAWRLASAVAGMVERRRRPQETPAEYAGALSVASPASLPMRDLAAMYGRARYGGPNAALPRSSRAWQRAWVAAAGLLRGKLRRRAKS